MNERRDEMESATSQEMVLTVVLHCGVASGVNGASQLMLVVFRYASFQSHLSESVITMRGSVMTPSCPSQIRREVAEETRPQ